ncbi:TIGR03936 family radical SAM-associated protein [Helicovermis profundi]|uniref:TIGR03936 family radical SAM-associated protein n=1 Tax=Helicovermis profundi TaxID=3065157 RepID=A0AAU9EU19_9FIRM|nr:TIGR03936 family radical SAM-associated protein [Clostridia bacterium S502]
MTILRMLYKKDGLMKFISHLDMVRLAERSFRRAKFPLEFSNGFNPRPKINFALPLSVGSSSEYEILDVKLLEKMDIDDFLKNQEKFVPTGIKFIKAKYVEETKSLMSLVDYANYIISFPINGESYKEKLKDFLDQDEIIIEKLTKKKKLKTVDIKAHIKKYSLLEDEEELYIDIVSKSGSNGNLNPMKLGLEIIDKLGMNLEKSDIRIHKKQVYTEIDGKLIELFEI